MELKFAGPGEPTKPIRLIPSVEADEALTQLDEASATWAKANGFAGKLGEVLVLPSATGDVSGVLIGIGSAASRERERFAIGAAISSLPEGAYEITNPPSDTHELEEIALGHLLARYRFDRYRSASRPLARLVAPDGVDAERVERIARSEVLIRDLVNTPAEDMGPDQLEAATRRLAEAHGASVTIVSGEALLEQKFPLIHLVGRAAARTPRLIDLRWNDEKTDAPAITLVGKGVCFDTGGLNLKPSGSMGLMKKDMGGAAHVLGLASAIMDAEPNYRLRVLIPAVENNVAGNSFRPGDIVTARNGMSVEINNTDAEGRLVLADALSYACESDPDLVVCMATLTGAARVALGPDIAPFFTDDELLAAALTEAGPLVRDPVWRLPFHAPYEAMIEPGIADLDNAPKGGMAGAITAALFLRRFAEKAPRFVHFDVYAWQPTAAPARRKGGVGQGYRAIFEAFRKVFS